MAKDYKAIRKKFQELKEKKGIVDSAPEPEMDMDINEDGVVDEQDANILEAAIEKVKSKVRRKKNKD